MTNPKTLLLLAALALGLTFAQPARAELTLWLQQGATTTTVVDGTGNPNDGVVTFIGALGTFTTNVTTGIGPGATPPGQLLDLNSVNVSSDAGGTLTIRLASEDFTAIGNLLQTIGGTVATGTATGSISWTVFRDTDNAFTITDPTTFGNAVCTGSANDSVTSAFSNTQSCASSGASPYALILQAVITHNGAASTSFDFSVEGKVPEPASMLLFGFGLVGLAVWGRKRLGK